MTNELLEQWRKEAEEHANSLNTYYGIILIGDVKTSYIEGCKATHEKMQKEVDSLTVHLENYYRTGMRDFLQNRELDEDIEPAIERSWQQFKTNNNIS